MKPRTIDLPNGTSIPILYEDRGALAIDKPAGWLLVPEKWEHTSRNLQRELMISMECGDFWARSRNLKYIRFVHRLDAETSGVLLMAKSPGSLSALSRLFETRLVRKKYMAVVQGVPKQTAWTCRLKISETPGAKGKMHVNTKTGKEAETAFKVIRSLDKTSLIEAEPLTGRTHQIRVHLSAEGHSVIGDSLYGTSGGELALRAVELSYTDPFHKKRVRITADTAPFLRHFGYGPSQDAESQSNRAI